MQDMSSSKDTGQPSPKAKRDRKPNSRMEGYAVATTAVASHTKDRTSEDVKLGRPFGDQYVRKKYRQSKHGCTKEMREARRASVEPDPPSEELGDDDLGELVMHQP